MSPMCQVPASNATDLLVFSSYTKHTSLELGTKCQVKIDIFDRSTKSSHFGSACTQASDLSREPECGRSDLAGKSETLEHRRATSCSIT